MYSPLRFSEVYPKLGGEEVKGEAGGEGQMLSGGDLMCLEKP